MAVTIRAIKSDATIDGFKWKSKNRVFMDTLNILSKDEQDNLGPWVPHPDLHEAERLAKMFKGKVTKVTNPPKFVEGRVY